MPMPDYHIQAPTPGAPAVGIEVNAEFTPAQAFLFAWTIIEAARPYLATDTQKVSPG